MSNCVIVVIYCILTSSLLTYHKGAKAVRAGYLLKRGEINKAWKVRWFELEDDKLKYFKSQDQAKAIDFIHLDQVVVRVCS